MDKMFDFDGPIARFLMVFSQLVVLNILALICSIPIITFGPSMKALAYCCLKISRNEEGYVAPTFFKSFKENFGQSVVLGLIAFVLLTIMGGGIYALVMMGKGFPLIIKIAFVMASILVVADIIWLFPMQARFTNTIKDTIKNAFWVSIVKAPKTLFMIIMWLFLPACYLFISGNFLPLCILMGLSFPAYFNSVVYGPYFRSLEYEIREKAKKDHPDSEDDSSSDNQEE